MVASNVKRIVCLANSKKPGGRCVAGKEVLSNGAFGAWVRPVKDQGGGAVPNRTCQYPNGSEPKVLDVLDIPLLGHTPKDYQQENWELAPRPPWRKVQRLTYEQAAGLIDPLAALWFPGHSTYNGLNDRVPLQVAMGLPGSLRLISVNNLNLRVFVDGEVFGEPRRRVQGRFRHEGLNYSLWVTDVVWEQEYLDRPNGVYPVGQAYLTVSLGEPHKEYAYKLIAAIISPEGAPLWKA